MSTVRIADTSRWLTDRLSNTELRTKYVEHHSVVGTGARLQFTTYAVEENDFNANFTIYCLGLGSLALIDSPTQKQKLRKIVDFIAVSGNLMTRFAYWKFCVKLTGNSFLGIEGRQTKSLLHTSRCLLVFLSLSCSLNTYVRCYHPR